MASMENGSPSTSPCTIHAELSRPEEVYMQKFRLYETQSKFYMIGRDKSRTYWRVLKIDRLDPSELNIREDSTTYTESECSDLLRRIHEGNKVTGGLKFVTTCYGIVGFIKFLGPYYMLLITKRRQIGAICGHNVYAVSKSVMIPLPNSSVQSNITNSNNENRYKKLLCMVDLTKDFFFSYSYHVMRSLQKNLCDKETGQVLYETMFVWNEFLTRGIRNHLQNTLWTVALVYGFFKQATLSISGRDFKLTLIARRSRHYAGTRYLKRGVNENGRVANDVETEQIVFEDVPEGFPIQISSVIQNRGSIPLFWSQETSRLNLKPDIILSRKDQNYEATRLHFKNLVKRYGNPIIILNLIKTQEKKPRESILRAEFANAIDYINKDLSEENRLRFLHWDLHKHTRRNTENGHLSPQNTGSNDYEDANDVERKFNGGNDVANGNHSIKPPMFQQGFTDTPKVDLDAPLADELMRFYERMGDTLAHQYGGSAAHNKPQLGKPALWELNSDQHYSVGRNGQTYVDQDRSYTGWILVLILVTDVSGKFPLIVSLSSKFLHIGWLSSSGNSCEEEPFERYVLLLFLGRNNHVSEVYWKPQKKLLSLRIPAWSSVLTISPIAGMSSENVVNGIMSEMTPSTSEYGSSMKGRQQTGTVLSYGSSQNSNVLEEFSDSLCTG
ncbi:hypothetical protein GH714_028610 [Hevea brasiliensis]|uniref:SAC domain-containing protein n=1 Tax=Hevea brasiliensis TaxID=3981 RepID=A0A6A6LVD5_HEVBR|nr:hypothetical protein GH714_028610 [Hevea brasiliensis]